MIDYYLLISFIDGLIIIKKDYLKNLNKIIYNSIFHLSWPYYCQDFINFMVIHHYISIF